MLSYSPLNWIIFETHTWFRRARVSEQQEQNARPSSSLGGRIFGQGEECYLSQQARRPRDMTTGWEVSRLELQVLRGEQLC